MKDLTVIIVTFNSSAVIEKCLNAMDAKKYDVVVVDNESKDDTRKIVQTNFPKVKLINSGGNIGYGRSNNLALRQAKTEFALILNPDAVIASEDIEASLQVFKDNPNIALANPKIFAYEEQLQKYKIDKKTKPFEKSGLQVVFYL